MTENLDTSTRDDLFSAPEFTDEEATEGAMFAADYDTPEETEETPIPLKEEDEEPPVLPKEETEIRLSKPEENNVQTQPVSHDNTSQDVLATITTNINRLAPSLTKLANRKASSSDMASFVAEIFDAALGFDKFSQLATSYSKDDDLMECLVSIEDKVRMVIKIVDSDKSPDALDAKSLESTISRHRVGWIITTNGNTWNVYRDMGGEYPMKVGSFELTDTESSLNTLKFFTPQKFIEEKNDLILDQYRPMFARIAHAALNSEPGLKLIQEALANEGMSVGMGVVRTITKGVLHTPPPPV